MNYVYEHGNVNTSTLQNGYLPEATVTDTYIIFEKKKKKKSVIVLCFFFEKISSSVIDDDMITMVTAIGTCAVTSCS